MITEQRNPKSMHLDLLDTREVLQLINQEDRQAATAVEAALPQLAQAVDHIAERLGKGGRLFYVGAGTSGRLGVLDAVECPPTFGVEPEIVQGILAGGFEACHRAVESAEDDPGQGERDIRERGITAQDAVVGISASGRTPYTVAALRLARKIGALTVGICCNRQAPLSREADIWIEIEVGPEVIAGSTRMKAGTAQKMVLNLLSTAVMVKLGHVYSNLMVNLHLGNRKLFDRAVRIVSEAAEVPVATAREALDKTEDVKSAIVMLQLGCSAERARELVAQFSSVRRALEIGKNS